MTSKQILLKSLRLQKYFAADKSQKDEVFNKFKNVWGITLANHFLSKYDDAETLIWALDDDNLKLFIDKF